MQEISGVSYEEKSGDDDVIEQKGGNAAVSR